MIVLIVFWGVDRAKRKLAEAEEERRRIQKQREAEIEANHSKATVEREERRQKLFASKKSNYDSRKSIASQTKFESKQIEEVVHHGKAYVEFEKRKKAEDERKR